MAKRYDAAIKHLVEAHPADWLAFARLPPATALEVVDADLSSVSPAADKVIRVTAPVPYVAHLEFQSGADPELDGRMLLYNVLLRWRHRLPVRSVVILLRTQAQSPHVTGRFRDAAETDAYLEFSYRIIRAWEQPVESILKGGLGTLPLAPLGAVEQNALPAVIEGIQERLTRETSQAEASDAWTATFILMGLRYSREVGVQLLKGVRNMEDSTTYQWIVEQGQAKGKLEEAKALLFKIGRRRFGPPSPDVSAALQAIADLPRIEALVERVIDVSSWDQLLMLNA